MQFDVIVERHHAHDGGSAADGSIRRVCSAVAFRPMHSIHVVHPAAGHFDDPVRRSPSPASTWSVAPRLPAPPSTARDSRSPGGTR